MCRDVMFCVTIDHDMSVGRLGPSIVILAFAFAFALAALVVAEGGAVVVVGQAILGCRSALTNALRSVGP